MASVLAKLGYRGFWLVLLQSFTAYENVVDKAIEFTLNSISSFTAPMHAYFSVLQ
jgi:hypothetical protein